MTREFGSVRQLPSGRWQARYRAPDGRRLTAPFTFTTKRAAAAWLAETQTNIERGRWVSPEQEAAEAADADGVHLSKCEGLGSRLAGLRGMVGSSQPER